jgi:hypothetical protein
MSAAFSTLRAFLLVRVPYGAKTRANEPGSLSSTLDPGGVELRFLVQELPKGADAQYLATTRDVGHVCAALRRGAGAGSVRARATDGQIVCISPREASRPRIVRDAYQG